MNKQKGRLGLSKAGSALSLGANMAVGMAVFAFLGYQAGKKFGHGDAWTLGGLFLGLVYCAYEVWKVVQSLKDTPNHAEKIDHGK